VGTCFGYKWRTATTSAPLVTASSYAPLGTPLVSPFTSDALGDAPLVKKVGAPLV
jgi:hypothetical protein